MAAGTSTRILADDGRIGGRFAIDPGFLRRRRVVAVIMQGVLFAAATLSVLVTAGIVYVLLSESVRFFAEVSIIDFLTDTQWTPVFENPRFGIMTLISGTLMSSLIALMVAMPLGTILAIYLSEYANSHVREIIKPFLELLAGVPTVAFGYFALLFATPLFQIFPPQPFHLQLARAGDRHGDHDPPLHRLGERGCDARGALDLARGGLCARLHQAADRVARDHPRRFIGRDRGLHPRHVAGRGRNHGGRDRRRAAGQDRLESARRGGHDHRLYRADQPRRSAARLDRVSHDLRGRSHALSDDAWRSTSWRSGCGANTGRSIDDRPATAARRRNGATEDRRRGVDPLRQALRRPLCGHRDRGAPHLDDRAVVDDHRFHGRWAGTHRLRFPHYLSVAPAGTGRNPLGLGRQYARDDDHGPSPRCRSASRPVSISRNMPARTS